MHKAEALYLKRVLKAIEDEVFQSRHVYIKNYFFVKPNSFRGENPGTLFLLYRGKISCENQELFQGLLCLSCENKLS